MTYRELFQSALAQVCESGDEGDISDYEERAGYILASFCTRCASADKKYRAAHGIQGGNEVYAACVALDGEFPLCDVFTAAASHYLAAMLTIDENEEMSERFFALYSDAISALMGDLPASNERITDRYGLI